MVVNAAQTQDVLFGAAGAAGAAAGVAIVLFNLPPGDWAAGERGIAVFPERADEFDRGLGRTLDYARVLGVPRLHMMAGLASAQDARARRRYGEALAAAADAAASHGLDILIEPIDGRDMPGYFLNDFVLAADLVAASGRADVKLQYGVYHRQILHGDVLASLETLLPIIGHMQTASVPLRHEPGTGELDDGAIFAALDRLGYAGTVGCEYRPAGATRDGLNWLAR